VQRGAPVALIDDTLTVDVVGTRAGSIGYEILTRLGRRYARKIVEG
jgi:alanine racemase